ncbi:MAG TPA: type IV pilin [Candidatus Thermoplasmatota archaeon]|nr:type IV pilin [Candidatus Thermoplasmatota archaeon]
MSANQFPRLLRTLRADAAVSPVIGTILMVAVTVVLGATVYAAVNGFGGEAVQDTPATAFKVQAVDTNGNGVTDSIKVLYVSGPEGIQDALQVTIAKANGGAVTVAPTEPATWSPGTSMVYNPDAAADGKNYAVTVIAFGKTVVDQTVAVGE